MRLVTMVDLCSDQGEMLCIDHVFRKIKRLKFNVSLKLMKYRFSMIFFPESDFGQRNILRVGLNA